MIDLGVSNCRTRLENGISQWLIRYQHDKYLPCLIYKDKKKITKMKKEERKKKLDELKTQLGRVTIIKRDVSDLRHALFEYKQIKMILWIVSRYLNPQL